MFNYDTARLDDHGKLLYEILQELRKQNKSNVTTEFEVDPIITTTKPCKHCGGTHETHSQLMICAKKNKKK